MNPAPSFPPFGPHPLLRNNHLMTLAVRIPRRNLRHVELGDGARVFRPDPDSSFVGYCHWQPERCAAPTLVVLHGLAGTADSNYVLGTADKAYAAGFNVIRITFRNCDDAHGGPELGHSGFTADLHHLLRELIDEDRLERIYLAGFSLGGNLMFKLAGELGADAPPELRGVVGVSPALDLEPCQIAIDEQRGNRLYQQYFLASLREKAARLAAAYPDRYDLSGLAAVASLRDFDELFTAPHCGFRDYRHYYEEARALPFVPQIRVPALVIHARDDPVVPAAFFDKPELHYNPHVRVVMTDKGGHCSFIAWKTSETPRFRDFDRWWAENRLVQYVLELEHAAGFAPEREREVLIPRPEQRREPVDSEP